MSTSPPFVIISPDEWNKAVWYDIDRTFATPVTRDEGLAEYAPTSDYSRVFQGEALRRNRLSEVRSVAVTTSRCFGVNVAKLVYGGLEKVVEVKFSFQEAANPYFVKDAARTALKGFNSI